MSLYKVSATVKLEKNDARIYTKRFQTGHSWFSVGGEAIGNGACEQALVRMLLTTCLSATLF